MDINLHLFLFFVKKGSFESSRIGLIGIGWGWILGIFIGSSLWN
jgi:hypothetical protein